MHPQIEILLQLQDMRSQSRELRLGERERLLEEEEFQVDADEAVRHLEEAIGELENHLREPVKARYLRVGTSLPRVVVPLVEGTCYGCFISIPTATAAGTSADDVLTCDNCGRFLYVPP